MIIQENQLVTALKRCVANVTFVSNDGSLMKVRCTLKPSLLPPQVELEEFLTPDHILMVWNVDGERWAHFNSASVVKFEPEV